MEKVSEMKMTHSKNIRLWCVLLWIFVLNTTCYWGIGLVLAFCMPILLRIVDKDWSKYSLLLLPLTLLSISIANYDYGTIVFSLGISYLFRVFLKDDFLNRRKLWLFFLVLTLSVAFVNVSYVFLPLCGLILSLPVAKFDIQIESKKWQRNFGCIFVLFIIVILVFSIGIDSQRNGKVCYLIHGEWAKPSPEYVLSDLRNECVYSYSEFVHLLNADTISDIGEIAEYTEMWIVTPTKPFDPIEIKKINQWVKKGGKLYLVSDHTDLYGHARCVNQLARTFNAEVDYAVTFNHVNNEFFKNVFGQTVSIKSGNTVKSKLSFPLVADYVWNEPAYYANENNFGPVTPSGNDKYGLYSLCSTMSYGLGSVVVLCDSTIFANFCVYQPYTERFVNFLRHYHPFGRLIFLLPLLLIALLPILLFENKYYMIVCLFSFLSCSYALPTTKLNYGESPQIWSGEEKFVYEGCQYACISTAYSLSPLSGHNPIWKFNVDCDEENVIWVSTNPPSNKNWRWIRIEDEHSEPNWDSIRSPFAVLYKELKVPYFAQNTMNNCNYIEAKGLINDRVMNSWWYNDGISDHRMNKISSFIHWLNKENFKLAPLNYDITEFGMGWHPCVLRKKKGMPTYLRLPKPLKTEGEIYLGYGVSADIYEHDGVLSLIGFSQKQENREAEEMWVVDYLE